jgi:hypothetical protein
MARLQHNSLVSSRAQANTLFRCTGIPKAIRAAAAGMPQRRNGHPKNKNV